MDAVEPARLVHQSISTLDLSAFLRDPPLVVAAGKAAGPMFTALSDIVRPAAAAVTAPVAGADGAIHRFDAGHPTPNAGSVAAADMALRLAARAAGERGLIVLLSGGASAMLAAPVEGVTLAEKSETSRALMAAGAAIHELNCVRKHLSRIKGGRLAAAARRTLTLALSDVHGPVPDDPSVIGSGPTVPDDTTFQDALRVLRERGVTPPPAVAVHLQRGARGEVPETVKTGDLRLQECIYRIIGNRATAVAGAAAAAAQLGFDVRTIEPATSGEAREAGRAFVLEAARLAGVAGRPTCILASGETTVTVRGSGRGGRNQEFALGAALGAAEVDGQGLGRGRAIVLGSAGTDGIDGPTDAAGALVDRTTLARASVLGLDPAAALAENDTYSFFGRLEDLIVWRPTGTNVGDLHVALIC